MPPALPSSPYQPRGASARLNYFDTDTGSEFLKTTTQLSTHQIGVTVGEQKLRTLRAAAAPAVTTAPVEDIPTGEMLVTAKLSQSRFPAAAAGSPSAVEPSSADRDALSATARARAVRNERFAAIDGPTFRSVKTSSTLPRATRAGIVIGNSS